MDFKKGDLVRFKHDGDLAIVVDVARDNFRGDTARVVWLNGASVGYNDGGYYLCRSFELVAGRKA